MTSITFATEVPFQSNLASTFSLRQEFVIPKLPQSVNFLALRESFLSEAPFVTSTNKFFFRKCVDSKFFQNILVCSFHFISESISDSCVVDTEKMNDLAIRPPLIEAMSSNLAEMFFALNLSDRDKFFGRLPETLGFMLINALSTATPKHNRIFNSIHFREILLDWCAEVICGMRFSNCHADRDWYFEDAVDNKIKTTAKPMHRMKNHVKQEFGALISKFTLSLSPLINIYLEGDHAKKETPFKVSLSELPNRPLTAIHPFQPPETDYSHVSSELLVLHDTAKKIRSDGFNNTFKSAMSTGGRPMSCCPLTTKVYASTDPFSPNSQQLRYHDNRPHTTLGTDRFRTGLTSDIPSPKWGAKFSTTRPTTVANTETAGRKTANNIANKSRVTSRKKIASDGIDSSNFFNIDTNLLDFDINVPNTFRPVQKPKVQRRPRYNTKDATVLLKDSLSKSNDIMSKYEAASEITSKRISSSRIALVADLDKISKAYKNEIQTIKSTQKKYTETLISR